MTWNISFLDLEFEDLEKFQPLGLAVSCCGKTTDGSSFMDQYLQTHDCQTACKASSKNSCSASSPFFFVHGTEALYMTGKFWISVKLHCLKTSEEQRLES